MPNLTQNSKSGSRDPHVTTFDLILHFFISTDCRLWKMDSGSWWLWRYKWSH